MTLFALWKEKNMIVLASQAKALSPDWKKETFECESCKEKLNPVSEQWRTREQDPFFVQPYFMHSQDSKCSLALNESEEHKSKKLKLLSLLFLEQIKVNVDGLETTLKKEWIKDKEVIRENNRADVLVEFNSFNPVYGNGIVFEVMETESNESIQEKTTLWLRRGYTIVKITKDSDLSDIVKNGVKINQPFLKFLLTDVQETYSNLQKLVLEAKNIPLQQRITESTDEALCCENCGFGSQDKRNPELFICWKFWKTHKIRRYVTKKNRCDFFYPRGGEM